MYLSAVVSGTRTHQSWLPFKNWSVNLRSKLFFNAKTLTSDDHVENAFKFSVKTYMSNVIDTLLDEGLYFLEKVRANTTRDDKIFDINKEPINKQILEDLFTADGSILALARYMIEKIKNNPRLIGEDKSEESAQITENKV